MTRADAIDNSQAEVSAPHATEASSADQLVLNYYDREHRALHRFLQFKGTDDSDAQEIVQETFLRLFEHLRRGGGQTNIRAWIYRVAHNLAKNLRSSAHRKHRTSESAENWTDLLAAHSGSPESEAISRERQRLLSRAIGSLTRPQRECIVLRSQGLKYREIAAILEISSATVGENIQRGLEKLKAAL